MGDTQFKWGFYLSIKESAETENHFKRSLNVTRLFISMMLILLVILVIFYMRILNGLDQSVQFSYFIMILIISIAVGSMVFIKDTWKDQGIYFGIIGIIVLCAIGFGFLNMEELNKVEVNVINPDAGSSVNSQFVVYGSFENVPENKDIWLYTIPSMTKKYYPEIVPVIKLNNVHSADGSWEYYYVQGINGFKSGGKPFQIGVFLSNKTDRIYIESEIARLNGSTRGMNQLPGKIQDMGVKINISGR